MREGSVPASLQLAAGVAWRVLVVVLAIAVAAYALATLRVLLLPVIVALLFATLFWPPVQWLRDRGVPAAVAALGTLLLTFVVIAGATAAASPYIVGEFTEFGALEEQVREGVDIVAEWAVEGPLELTEGQVQDVIDQAEGQLRDLGPELVGGTVAGAVLVVEVITGGILAVVLLFFFLYDGPRMWAWAARLFPRSQRTDVHELGQRVWTALGGFLRAQIIVALVDAVAIGALLVILGVPLAIPLAVLIFFGGFVPILGAFVTGFLAVMVALASDGVVTALIVLAGITLVQQLEGNVLEPFIVSRYVHLHPVAVLLAVSAGFIIWGIPGAFIAAPLLATVNTAGSYLASRSGNVDESPEPPEPLDEAVAGAEDGDEEA